MAECKKCGREMDANKVLRMYDWCDVPGNLECEAVAAAYHRGIARGVAIAKEEIVLDQGNGYGAGGASIDWTDVDRAVREECGE